MAFYKIVNGLEAIVINNWVGLKLFRNKKWKYDNGYVKDDFSTLKSFLLLKKKKKKNNDAFSFLPFPIIKESHY